MAKVSVIQLLLSKDSQLNKDKAAALVVCNNVYVNGELCTDTKQMFPKDSSVDIIFPKYVSRGGFKLEKALDEFEINVSDLVMLDAGSSTGGFSDCMLQRGAKAVHCVDVGWNLLDFKLRNNSKVVVHEKTNIMALEKTDLNPVPDAAVADLSFRSIRGAATHVLSLTKQNWMIALIKPQFEVPKWQENFSGVINDPVLLHDTLENVFDILSQEKIAICKATVSPIKGHKGNTEFLVLLRPESEVYKGMSKESFLNSCLNQYS